VPEAELARMLADEGLRCCGYHGSFELIRNKPEELIEITRILGIDHIICPYLPGFKWGDLAATKELVKDLDKAGAIFRNAGVTLSYHNHAMEFVRVGDTTMLDYIYSHTDPKCLQAELDTYWVQFGGGNPAAWCKKLKNRLPLLHIKDYGFTVENKPLFEAIGSGNLDWHDIIPTAEAAGCQWFIVEQDTTIGDPFEAAASSFQFITKNFIVP
jgi:sugar phosphate isomerase/epimerase